MKTKRQASEEFKKEIFGYNKNEVDEFVNILTFKLEVLSKDVEFLKEELRRIKIFDERLLKPADK